MATYSSFFSSGLLAPRVARYAPPVLPSSPMAIATGSVDPVDRQLNSTPTPLGQTGACPTAPEAQTIADHPRIRRRRSSINIAASPMALIKSPARNAGAALQRTGIMSPTRHRAASVGLNGASECNSLFGRLRSGSMGGATNPPKRQRRAIRVPIPLVPPPNVPLPALPSSPTVKGSFPSPPAIFGPILRQPFLPILSTDENPRLPRLLGPDYACNMPVPASQALFGSCGDMIDEARMEN